MGGSEGGTFLSSLARDRSVSASTQNQVLAALLFLYARLLERKLGWGEGVTRAKTPGSYCLSCSAGRRSGPCCRGCKQSRPCATTMLYTDVLNRGPAGVRSPLDR
jgi:hypothetical protein